MNSFVSVVMLLSLFLIYPTYAEENIEVLEYGNCWYQSLDESWKIVSFNDQSIWHLNPSDVISLKYLVEARIKKELASGENTIEIFFHCLSSGSRLIINWRTGDEAYVIYLGRGRPLNDLDPRDLAFYSNPKKLEGFQLGAIPGELLLFAKNHVQLNQAEEVLKNHSSIIKMTQINPLGLKVEFQNNLHFKESSLKESLESEFQGRKINIEIEYNHNYLPVGTFLSLFQLAF